MRVDREAQMPNKGGRTRVWGAPQLQYLIDGQTSCLPQTTHTSTSLLILHEHSHLVCSSLKKPKRELRRRSTETFPQMTPGYSCCTDRPSLVWSAGSATPVTLQHGRGMTKMPLAENEDNLKTENSHLFRAGLVSTFRTPGATLSIVVHLCLRCHSTDDLSALRYVMDFPWEENAHAHSTPL